MTTTVSGRTPVSPKRRSFTDGAALEGDDENDRRLFGAALADMLPRVGGLRFVPAYQESPPRDAPRSGFVAVKRAIGVALGAVLGLALVVFLLVLIGWAIGLFVGAAGAAFGAIGTIRRARASARADTRRPAIGTKSLPRLP